MSGETEGKHELNVWKNLKKSAAKRLNKLKTSGIKSSKQNIIEGSLDCVSSADESGSSDIPGSHPTRNLLSHQQSLHSGGDSSSLLPDQLSSFDDTQSDIIPLDGSPGAKRRILPRQTSLTPTTRSLEESMEKKRSRSLKDLADSSPYRLEITIISGSGLIAKDRNGFSDPYVKIRYKGKNLHRTRVIDRNLNPKWNETFSVPINELEEPVYLRVYDHDTFSGDDFMGFSSVVPADLRQDGPSDYILELRGEKYSSDANLGQLSINCTLCEQNLDIVNPSLAPSEGPKIYGIMGFHMGFEYGLAQINEILGGQMKYTLHLKQYYYALFQSIISLLRQDTSSSNWDYTVRVVLLEGYDLLAMDDNGLSDPYVKFKLQSKDYKSKVKSKTLCPHWMEVFSMRLFDKKSWIMDVNVFDHNIAGRADFIGRSSVDLSELEKDKTHHITLNLEDQSGKLRLLITITGAVSSTDHEISLSQRKEIVRKYGLVRSFTGLKDVGWLQLKVIRAHGLASMDWGGTSDPFCTVELVNTMLQTHTSYKTLNPEWNRVFTLPVYDIHSVLVITVFDEDKDMKKEFIGKVAIPLTMIENGVQKWYGLKNKKLLSRVKGEILLELDMEFNHIKAAVRTINPREEPILKDEPKFKLAVFRRNVDRIRSIISCLVNAKNFWQSLIDWHYPWKSILAFIMLLVAVWNFELYMIPLTLILLLVWNYLVIQIKGGAGEDMVVIEAKDEEDDEIDDEKEENRRSISETIDAVKSVCCTIQEILGQIADILESVKNSFVWTIPWLSTLAIVALTIIMYILYLVPFRYIVLLWTVNKFTKRLRKPNYIPNNEVLDFLSRVPSDIEKVMYKEIRPDLSNIEGTSNGRSPSARRKKT